MDQNSQDEYPYVDSDTFSWIKKFLERGMINQFGPKSINPNVSQSDNQLGSYNPGDWKHLFPGSDYVGTPNNNFDTGSFKDWLTHIFDVGNLEKSPLITTGYGTPTGSRIFDTGGLQDGMNRARITDVGNTGISSGIKDANTGDFQLEKVKKADKSKPPFSQEDFSDKESWMKVLLRMPESVIAWTPDKDTNQPETDWEGKEADMSNLYNSGLSELPYIRDLIKRYYGQIGQN